jgi:hypothetical protein
MYYSIINFSMGSSPKQNIEYGPQINDEVINIQ